MSFSREQWATDFLHALGNPNPSPAVVDWVVGWTVHETGTGGGATYNLLNTTQRASGSSNFNSVGVQNYPNYSEGVQENAIVLGQNFAGYSALKQALANNDISALNQPTPQVKQGLKTWCGGCGYGVGFESLGISHLGDLFNYGNPGSVPTGSGGGTSPQTSSGGQTTSPLGSCPPCPSNTFSNLPILGGVYCAGWNTVQIPCHVSSGVSQNVQAVLSDVNSIIFRVIIFGLGLAMFVVGVYLLASKAEEGVGNVVLDNIPDTGGGESSPSSGKSSEKPSKSEKVAKAAKLAEMAA